MKKGLKRARALMSVSAPPTASLSGGGGGAADRIAPSGGGGSSSREGSAKAMVADQITQAVQSTSNLLHLMLQSSPSQDRLMTLPKNLLAKASMIKNTEQVLEQMPLVIASLDAHVDLGLQSVPRLKTVIQLLENINSSQLKPLAEAQLSKEGTETVNQPSNGGRPT